MKTNLIRCFVAIAFASTPLCVNAAITAANGAAGHKVTLNETPGSGLTGNLYSVGQVYGTTAGGEFVIREVGGPDIFKTFCLEQSEHVSIGGTYWYDIGPAAIGGGGGPNPDPVSDLTKFLYGSYVLGDLNGFDLGGGVKFHYDSDSWANALQNAIWYTEQEIAGPLTGDALLLYDYANLHQHDTTDYLGVQALNLYNDAAHTSLAQSQLILPPPGADNTPEPVTLAIWSALAGSAFGLRRFTRRSK